MVKTKREILSLEIYTRQTTLIFSSVVQGLKIFIFSGVVPHGDNLDVGKPLDCVCVVGVRSLWSL